MRAVVCKRFQSLFPIGCIFMSMPVTYSSEQPILFSVRETREMFTCRNRSCCRDAQTRANLSFCVRLVHSHGVGSLGAKSSAALCRALCPQVPEAMAGA